MMDERATNDPRLRDLLNCAAEHWMTQTMGGLTTQAFCACGWTSKRRLRWRKVEREGDQHQAKVAA